MTWCPAGGSTSLIVCPQLLFNHVEPFSAIAEDSTKTLHRWVESSWWKVTQPGVCAWVCKQSVYCISVCVFVCVLTHNTSEGKKKCIYTPYSWSHKKKKISFSSLKCCLALLCQSLSQRATGMLQGCEKCKVAILFAVRQPTRLSMHPSTISFFSVRRCRTYGSWIHFFSSVFVNWHRVTYKNLNVMICHRRAGCVWSESYRRNNWAIMYLISLPICCTQVVPKPICVQHATCQQMLDVATSGRLYCLEYAAQCFLSIRSGLWALYKLMLNIWKKTWKSIRPRKSDCSLKPFPYSTRVVVTNSGPSEFAEELRAGRRCHSGGEKMGADGALKDVTATIWLTEWLITAGGGEELRRGRGFDCNEGWEDVGWGGGALKANPSHRLRAVEGAAANPWRRTRPFCCARSVTPTDDVTTDRCAQKM